MRQRIGSARWIKEEKRWRISVNKDNSRKVFYSNIPGKEGRIDANNKADEWLASDNQNPNEKIDVIWALYLADLKNHCGTSGYKQIESFGRSHILPEIGNLKISNLTEGKLQGILDKAYRKSVARAKQDEENGKTSNPLSKKTLADIRMAEGNFVKWARKNRWTTLRLEGLIIPNAARKGEKKILQPAALKTLFSVDTKLMYGQRRREEYINAFRFVVVTGLRPGELVGLEVGDVIGKTICLKRSLNRYKEETRGKNENALRTFVLNQFAVAILQEQMKRISAGNDLPQRSESLFQVESQESFYRHWKKYQTDNEIVPPISLYELRHTFVSMAKNLPEGQLKPVVGHSEDMDSLGTYGHEIEGERELAAQAITDVLRPYIELNSENKQT